MSTEYFKKNNYTHMEMIERLHKEKGIIKNFIYEKIGVSRQAVHKWEKDGIEPKPEHLKKLVTFYRQHFEIPETPIRNNMVSESMKNYSRVLYEPEFVNLPFVRVPARAGFNEMASHEDDYGITERLAVLRRPDDDFRDCICIEVDGDSMEPQLRSGTIVLAQLVSIGNWPQMPPGVYAFSYDNSFVIKRIKDNTLAETGAIKIYSDNPNSGYVTVEMDSIRYIWRVLRIVDGKVS